MRWIDDRAPGKAASAAGKPGGAPAPSTTVSITDRSFIGHLSHELRTSMNGVVGLTELLANATDLGSRHRNLIEEIQESSGTLWGVISDFLDYARLGSNILELHQETFDPHRMVAQAVDQIALDAQHRLLDIAGYVDPAISGCVIGDASRLRQALANLVAAAIRLTRAGEIVVRARPGQETASALALRLEVEASGARLPAAKLRSLFEPFTLSDDSVTRRDAGSGLGLAVALRLVRLMGGDAGARPGPGKGCTLWLETGFLPRRETPASATRSYPRLADKRVLLAVGNPRIGALLLQQLQDVGLRGELVGYGKDALDRLRGKRKAKDAFDLAILDRELQDLDGLAIAGILESEGLAGNTKVMLLSPLTQEGDPDELQGRLIACELTKPIAAGRLYAALDAVLSDRPPREQAPGAHPDPSTIASVTPPVSILVAEDNPVNRNLAKAVLERAGYRVVEAENGEEAVAACKVETFDLILLDCRMPVMDGFGAARAIRAWEQGADEGRQVPIIAVTANAFEEDRRRCLAAGMDGFLSKPFHQKELLELLHNWLAAPLSGIEE